MNKLKKETIDFVFNYFIDHNEYNDKEDLIYAGQITEEDYQIQLVFEEFVFNLLPICSKEKKCYSDEEDCFENYTMYVSYKNTKLILFVLYGQGNYFNIKKYTPGCDFKNELLFDLDQLITNKTDTVYEI